MSGSRERQLRLAAYVPPTIPKGQLGRKGSRCGSSVDAVCAGWQGHETSQSEPYHLRGASALGIRRSCESMQSRQPNWRMEPLEPRPHGPMKAIRSL